MPSVNAKQFMTIIYILGQEKYIYSRDSIRGISLFCVRKDYKMKENNKITIEGTPCLVDWAYENFDIYRDELDTYNFVFKEENNHINLVDFYIN